VVPSIRDGKTVLICAHGNIIRAMLKRLDCIPNDPLKEVRSRDSMSVFWCRVGCEGGSTGGLVILYVEDAAVVWPKVPTNT